MGVGAAILAGAAIAGTATVASGVIGSSAASSAAKAQTQAANQAEQIQQADFNTAQQNVAPFIAAGQSALGPLQQMTGTNVGNATPGVGSLTAPFADTQAQLAATPGYQFTLGQGLQATQNSYAAQGLGSSGAALKGAANYAEGLAGTTYQQQFGNYLSQNQQIYNMLGGLVGTGQGSAVGLVAPSVQSGANIGQTVQSGGAAAAGGIVGSANATSGALNALGGSASNTGLLLSLNNQGLFGNSASTSPNGANGNGF
jgi:hypothetical protein